MTDTVSLRSLFVEYTRFRLRGARENSRGKFAYALDHWARFLGREPTIADLTDDAVLDVLWEMRRTLAADTVNGYGAKIAALWRFASRRHLVDSWPEFKPLPTEQNLPVAFTREEIRDVFSAIKRQQGAIGDIPANRWWMSLCLGLWDSGERISAMLSARWADLRDDRLTIRAGERKGKMGSRKAACYRLHPQTLEAINEIRQPSREAIWPWPYDRSLIWHKWKGVLTAACVPPDRYHMLHCFRRSMASYAEQAGLDASRLLGHSDRRITEGSYLSPEVVHRPAACDVLFRPGS